MERRSETIELYKKTGTISLLSESVAGWLLWGATLYVCAVGCAGNFNSLTLIEQQIQY